jgi:hypothetical protein
MRPFNPINPNASTEKISSSITSRCLQKFDGFYLPKYGVIETSPNLPKLRLCGNYA